MKVPHLRVLDGSLSRLLRHSHSSFFSCLSDTADADTAGSDGDGVVALVVLVFFFFFLFFGFVWFEGAVCRGRPLSRSLCLVSSSVLRDGVLRERFFALFAVRGTFEMQNKE